ncbi:class I SAM-dependent methyltransferase [Halalkalibacterium ligniniphilum]|uniref:class I SAM-dependent methyltransferase n=1 Tax=Halalkalibacterium ligniniphilum TaxID=1134413 RepID=UPI000344F8C0|nr:class I SAM-dependent methyltransferase [Halalkalibacterium ligniniphilum]
MSEKRFSYQKAEVLLDKKRLQYMTPTQAAFLLNVQESDEVLDIGAGNGFFTLEFAKMAKHVDAVDVQQEMLALLAQRAKEEGVTNLSCHHLSATNLALEKRYDKMFTSFVYHEVDDLSLALQQARERLKNGGSFLVIEWDTIETEIGPPLHHRISYEEMGSLLSKEEYMIKDFGKNDGIYYYLVE